MNIKLKRLIRNALPDTIRLKILQSVPKPLKKIVLYVLSFGAIDGLSILHKLIINKTGLVKITISWLSKPFFVRANSSDIQSFEEVFVDDDYEIPVELDQMPRLIIDGGANIGCVSVFFADQYPDSRVIAIEPESSNFDVLRQNASYYPNITTIQAGIWNKRVALQLENPNANNMSFRIRESNDGKKNTITALTMDDIIHFANASIVDILKLDIEGAEKELFSQSPGWLNKVRLLIIELHDRYNPGCQESLYSALANYKYTEVRKGSNLFIKIDQ